MTKILGIDPSLTSLGWGIIQAIPPRINYITSGVIKTSSKVDMPTRLATIVRAIEDIIMQHKPDAISMEETFVNVNALSSLKLAYVRGSIMAIIGKYGLPYNEFLPNKIKKTIVGAGHAEKAQVQHMINIIISGSPTNISYDEADALATAYTYSVYPSI